MPSLLALLAAHGIRGTISHLHTSQTTEPLSLLPSDTTPRQQYAFVRRHVPPPRLSEDTKGRGDKSRGERITSLRKNAALKALWVAPCARPKLDVFVRVCEPLREMEGDVLPARSGELAAYRKVNLRETIKDDNEGETDDESDEEEEEERKSLPDEVWLAKQIFLGKHGYRFRPTKRLENLTEEEVECLRDCIMERRLAKMKNKAKKAREREQNKQNKTEAKKRREDRAKARRVMMRREKARQEKQNARERRADRKRATQKVLEREKARTQQPKSTPSHHTRVGHAQPSRESDTTLTSSEHLNGSGALLVATATHKRTKLSRPSDASTSYRSSTHTVQKSSVYHDSTQTCQMPLRLQHKNSVNTAVYTLQTSHRKRLTPSPKKSLASPITQQPDMKVDKLPKLDDLQYSPARSSASTIRAVLPDPKHVAHGKLQDPYVKESASLAKSPTIYTMDPNSPPRSQSATNGAKDLLRAKQQLAFRQELSSISSNRRTVHRRRQTKTLESQGKLAERQELLKKFSEESPTLEDEEEKSEFENGKELYENACYRSEL